MPIVHFSVLLVFKKFATHDTTISDPVCSNTATQSLLQKLAEHRSGISQVREYIFSKLSRERTIQFLHTPRLLLSLTASRLKQVAGN